MVGEFRLPPGVDASFAKMVIESTTWHGVIFQDSAASSAAGRFRINAQ